MNRGGWEGTRPLQLGARVWARRAVMGRVLQDGAQFGGGVCLAAAGWRLDPSIGLAVLAMLLFVWSQPKKGGQ